jgi:hypothetical protein
MDATGTRVVCGSIEIFEDKTAISLSNYCVKCYPTTERACYIYKGNSLCEDCFKKQMCK